MKSLRHHSLRVFLRLCNLFSSAGLLSKNGPVVSLTSYGARIGSVFYTIESIAQGTLLPSRLILWLDDMGGENTVPRSIERLKRRGLEVYFRENLKPHSKYFHFIQSVDSHERPLVTADDDIIYPEFWLEQLDASYRAYPDLINCFRARRIKFDHGKLAPYEKWETCENEEAGYLNFATGVSGVIYPPRFLELLKAAGRGFVDCCPRADDVWLHVNAIRNGFKIRQISSLSKHFLIIPNTQETGLLHSNVTESGNDLQIAKTYTQQDIEILRQAALEEGRAT